MTTRSTITARTAGRRTALWLTGVLAFPASHAVAQIDRDEDAKLNAKAVLVSVRLHYLRHQSYAGVFSKELKEKNPELRFVDDGPSAHPAVISVKVLNPQQLRMAVYGGKTCWGVREEGRHGGVATLYAKRPGPSSDCKATSFKDADFREHELVWSR